MPRTRSWKDLRPGDVLFDMHDWKPLESRLPIEESHQIESTIRIRTPGGSDVIVAALREEGLEHFSYTNKYLVVLEVSHIDRGRITAAWSYDDRVFGVMSIRVLPQYT